MKHTCTMLNKLPTVQASVATEDDSSNAARKQITSGL